MFRAREFISENDLEMTVSKLLSSRKIGETVTIAMVIKELGLIIQKDKENGVNQKLSKYVSATWTLITHDHVLS